MPSQIIRNESTEEKHIREEFSEISGVESHDELRAVLTSESSFVGR